MKEWVSIEKRLPPPKDIFVMMDTSRAKAFENVEGFIPCSHYQINGIYLLSSYEWGCFKSGNTNIRVILCSGCSMPVEQFVRLWNKIYPEIPDLEAK